MKQVLKYELTDKGVNELRLPTITKILYVGVQHDRLYLWVLSEWDETVATRHFFVADTGDTIPRQYCDNYLGTAIFSNGIVHHVFEK